MQCNICGTELMNGENVCRACGAVYNNEGVYTNQPAVNQMMYGANGTVAYGMQPHAPKKSKSWLVILLSVIGALVIAAIIAIVCVIVFSSDEYKQKSIDGTVELFFEAIEDGDYEKYTSLVPPYWQKHLRGSAESVMKNHLKSYMQDHYCGSGNELEYEITDIEEMDSMKFAQVKYNLKNWYDITGDIESYVYVDLVVTDSRGNEWTYTDFDFIKIDGVWYIGFGNI